MLKQNIIFIAFFILLILPAPAIPDALVDAETVWLMVDATPDARPHELLDVLVKLLVNRGKVPAAQIHHIEGNRATSEEIRALLREIGNNRGEKQTLIFLYHGSVTKPRGMNTMHLLTRGDDMGIADYALNQWFQEAWGNSVFVIIDGYTNDTNLNAYYANRETLGTAALNAIQSAEIKSTIGENSLLQQIINALTIDATDVNNNRQLSIIEIYENLRSDANFSEAILAPTGDVEVALLKLGPAIQITTFPEGAQIILNDVDVGKTPQLITDNLIQGTSTVTVKKPGYMIPPAKIAELRLALGESVHLGWALEPIAVFGTVSPGSEESVEGARVWIHGKNYEYVVAEDGTYRFDEWKSPDLLTPGETYTLSVKHGDLNYGSANFTFDGYTSIEQPLSLTKRTWFEMAQIAFEQGSPQGAITAFQNGIELNTDFPPLSPALTVLLLSSFAQAAENADVQDVNYLVVTAKLAEQHGQPELAKKYWEEVKAKAQKGTAAATEARERLWALNKGRYLINIALLGALGLLIISGAWTFYRYRKSKHGN